MRRKGRRYGVLRHDGSIEACDDLRLLAEGAGGGGIHEARVARMLNSMNNRGVAIVGIRMGRLAFKTLGTRIAAGAARDGYAGGSGA